MEPDSECYGVPHTVFKRDPITGKITNYETYKLNPKNPKTGLDVEKKV